MLYSPAILANAAGIQPATLRAWRNLRGLKLSAEGEGHKKHSTADGMRVIAVKWFSQDTTDVSRAIRIVNRYFDAFAQIGASLDRGDIDGLRQKCPIIFAVPGPEDRSISVSQAERRDLKFERRGEFADHIAEANGLPFGAVVLDFPTLVTKTQIALARAVRELEA